MTLIYYPPTQNGLQKSLNAQLDTGVTASMTLNNVTGVQNKPGVVLLGRVDSGGTELDASLREFIVYTGTSGSTLTGLTRGIGGSTDQDHAIGTVVEFIHDITFAQGIIDFLLAEHNESDGTHKETALDSMIAGTEAAGDIIYHNGTIWTRLPKNASNLLPLVLESGLPAWLTGDMTLPTGSNIQVNGADPKRGIYVPASAMFPSTTAPCASLTQVESTTNDVNIKVLDFDGAGTSKEYAEFGIPSPSYWDASTVTATFYWYATAGSGTVNWEIQGLALADDDALDTAYGTLQEVTDTLLATGDVHVSAETSAVTVAGSPTAGDWVQFKVARDPANDTNTSDARLMGVRIRFGIAKYDDQ